MHGKTRNHRTKEERDLEVVDWLKKNKGNSSATDKFRKFVRRIKSMQEDENPYGLSDKIIHHPRAVNATGNIYEYKMDRSYRILYTVDHDKKVVRIAKIGNHKTVFGHD